MKRRWLLFCATLWLLAACGGRAQAPVVENPYEGLMQELTTNGVLAMQRERWVAAEHSFVRALQAAQLTADPALIAHAWYNLGMAYVAQGRLGEGDKALQQAEGVARRHQLSGEYERARLNRALLAARQGQAAWQPAPFSRRMPIDIHLAAARLADLQGRSAVTEEEYGQVLSLADETSASGLRYRAEAHLGLALLALARKEPEGARRHVALTLEACRQAGAPRLAAHALMLQADLASNPGERQDSLERARGIYHALEDYAHERKVMRRLLAMAVEAGQADAERQLREALGKLDEKLENNKVSH